jgi:diguanylate cyclase
MIDASKPFGFSKWDLSPTGRGRVALVTLAGMFGSMAVAILIVSYTTTFMTSFARDMSFMFAVLMPLLVSGPVFYFFSSKLRELALAHRELARIASQDSLTTCLNRGAFVTLVDAYLSQVNSRQPLRGGLLVVDADHFKDVNDRYGHLVGDDALRRIAAVIKGSLRETDLVGRVGGEEFAVFLPLANMAQAKAVAERIRQGVTGLDFSPLGHSSPLSVSVGGAMFRGAVSFEQLFGAADGRLYEAKKHGRNRVEFMEWRNAA